MIAKTMILGMILLSSVAGAKEPSPSLVNGLDLPVAKVITTFHQGINKGDKQAVLAALDPNVMIFEGKGVERSKAEYAKGHLLSDIKFMQSMTVTRIEPHIVEQGSMAFSVGKNRIQGNFHNKDYDFISTESLSLHLVNGVWLINYIHWSN